MIVHDKLFCANRAIWPSSIGTPETINFPFVPNGKLMFYVSQHSAQKGITRCICLKYFMSYSKTKVIKGRAI